MKVRVTFTVDIDPEAWSMNYGLEGAKAIREDVQTFARLAVLDQLAAVGVLND